MEIKAADISDLEKNRMDIAASQAFTAEAVNISESISSADMYIEHNLFILRMKREKERLNAALFILALLINREIQRPVHR